MFFWTKLCSRRLQLFAQNIKNNHHSSEKLQQREVTRNQMATSIEDLYDTQCKLIELDMCPWVGGPWWLLFVQKKQQKITELPVWLYINLGGPKWWITTKRMEYVLISQKKKDPKICGPKLVPCILLGAWCDSIVRSWQYPLKIVAPEKHSDYPESIYYLHIYILQISIISYQHPIARYISSHWSLAPRGNFPGPP